MQDKLTSIAQNCVTLHEKCTLRHYVTTAAGDGTGTLSFTVPFEPDLVHVISTDPRLRLTANTLMSCVIDIRGFGFAAGTHSVINAAGSFTAGGTTTNSLGNYYERSSDGTVTIHDLRGISGSAVFGAGFEYIILAVCYTDKTDQQRITEFVEGLTGSGTAELCADKINRAFTQEEWSALIATKPDWTIEEV